MWDTLPCRGRGRGDRHRCRHRRRRRPTMTDKSAAWMGHPGDLLHDRPARVRGMQKRKSKMKNRTRGLKNHFHLKASKHWHLNLKNITFCMVFWESHSYQPAQKAGLVLFHRARREANTQKKVIPSIKLRAWSPHVRQLLSCFSVMILTNHLINTSG